MKAEKTERGFQIFEFDDLYGVGCNLQQSSLANVDAIWLGCADADVRHLVPGQGWTPVEMPPGHIVSNTRMHLTRKQVLALLPHLLRFLFTGRI